MTEEMKAENCLHTRIFVNVFSIFIYLKKKGSREKHCGLAYRCFSWVIYLHRGLIIIVMDIVISSACLFQNNFSILI